MTWEARRREALARDAYLISQVVPRVDFADGSQACADEPTAFDLAPTGDEHAIATAKRICRRCPLRIPCLAYAVDAGEAGIWGGRTETDRRRIARIIRSHSKESAS